MRVELVPMLWGTMDNYAYLLIDESSGDAAWIDPAEFKPALEAEQAAKVRATQIFNTHHHRDHTGGNLELLAHRPEMSVVGFAEDADRIPGITRPVRAGDEVWVGEHRGEVLFVPCHTRGHIAYLFGDRLFSGDTLFVGGCGRFFEGSAKEMHHALYQVFGGLPGHTRLYCGHEYTESNLDFALTLEPNNSALRQKREEVRQLRAAGRPSIPTTLDEERSYNPFLRVDAPELCESVCRVEPEVDPDDPVAVLAAVRRLKDAY